VRAGERINTKAGPIIGPAFFLDDWESRIVYNDRKMNLRKLSMLFLSATIVAAISVGATIAIAGTVMDKLGPGDGKSAMVSGGDVQAVIRPSVTQAAPGQKIEVTADFTIAPEWHIYGKPISTDYVPTSVTFDNAVVAQQSLDFPKPQMMTFAALGQTLPVYKGNVHAGGNLLLRPDLKPGEYQLTGKVDFQECSESMCKIPQSLPFAIPLTIAAR
jgi:Disulphide bond corrector protein DsbC